MTLDPSASANAVDASTTFKAPRKRAAARASHARRPGAQKLEFRDPERTKSEIVAAATAEFCAKGYDGARLSKIVERTRTSKRMIYYYFGSKKNLYESSIITHYKKLQSFSDDICIDSKSPRDALSDVVRYIFDWNIDNAGFTPLVMNENIMRGKYINQIDASRIKHDNILVILQSILDSGADKNEIRKNIKAIDLYTSIAALSFFNASNKYTISALFDHDMMHSENLNNKRNDVVFMIDQFVKIES